MTYIGQVTLDIELDKRTITPNPSVMLDIKTLPEDTFFKMRDSGQDTGDYLPLPSVVPQWSAAMLQGEFVLYSDADDDIFLIADTTNSGLALYHYVFADKGPFKYRLSYHRPHRTIKPKGEIKIMANPVSSLNTLMQNYSASMDLPNGNVPSSSMTPVSSSSNDGGISAGADQRKIQRTALINGYVEGYIMGNAPACNMQLVRTRNGENTVYSIEGRESKPSRPLAVLMTLPARCVKKGGILASPAEIMNGLVDFTNTPADEYVRQAFPISAAISYIGALGCKIPEYAPNVTESKSQWTPEDILSERAGVSFVKVHATQRKDTTSSTDRFRLSLKTTSDRRTLYTPHNIGCLRAFQHISTKVTSEKDAYALNESAFGAWRYRHGRNDSVSVLEKAFANCPSVIWKKKYEIDGETLEGIGSVFFMDKPTENNEAGEPVTRRNPTYFPWWQSGKKRPNVPSDLTQIVKRELKAATDGKKERMVTLPVTWSEMPNNPMFKLYAPFMNSVIEHGYLNNDQLKALCGSTRSRKARADQLTSDQLTSLRNFMESDDVMSAVQAVQDAVLNESILRSSAG